jgi:hypothetical protein
MPSFDQQGPARGKQGDEKRTDAASRTKAMQAERFSSPSWTRTSDPFKGFPQKEKSFDVLVRLRWAMKNALAAPPFS